MHDAQVSELQNDLKSLIELEPYAHRARQIKNQNEERLLKQNLPRALQPPIDGREKLASKMTNKEIESWINNTLEVQLQERKSNYMVLILFLCYNSIGRESKVAEKVQSGDSLGGY